MKLIYLIFIPVLITNSLFGQNTPPAISNVAAVLMPAQNNATLTFDVSDSQQSNFEATVLLSADGGDTFVFPIESLSGEGDVVAGNGQTLTVTFNADSLTAYGINATELIAKITVSDNQTVDIQTLVDQVTEASLINWMSQVEGIRHRTGDPDHLNEVRTLIENEMTDADFFMRSQDFDFANFPSKNIIGRKAGSALNTNTIVLCGHYDTISNSPGADDNGSAVCGLLEALNILQNYEFEKSLLFIGFDNEEDGLIGAYTFTGSGMAEYETIESVINMEMIGYYSDQPNSQTLPPNFEIAFPSQVAELEANDFRGDFITNVGSTFGPEIVAAFNSNAALYVPDLSVISLSVLGTGTGVFDDLRRSDHAAFWDQLIPALMITDGANFRNPFYHTANDVTSTLDFDFMANVVKAIVATLASEAGIISATSVVTEPFTTISSASQLLNDDYSFNLYQNDNQVYLNYQLPKGVENASVNIYNLNGQTIETINLNNNAANLKIDISHTNALYLLSINISGYKTLTQKIIIK